jgi:hypothetical protein
MGTEVRTAAVLILSTQERVAKPQPEKESAASANPPELDLLGRLAFVDVLGRSVMLRMLDRLKSAAVEPVTVWAEIPDGLEADNVSRLDQDVPFRVRPMIEQFAQQGAQLVVCLRLGPYAEIDFAELLRFHAAKKASYTTAHHQERKLPVFVADLVRPAKTVSALLDWLDACQIACAQFPFSGYVNDLQTLSDLRRLAKDGLMRESQLQPIGKEVRRGIWCGDGARVSSEARLVAPAYIGAMSVIRAGALITRASNIERNCEVDLGTAVEDSSLLPETLAGPGLEFISAIADGSKLHDLRRHTHIDVEDQKILASISARQNPLRRIRAAVPAWLNAAGKAPTAG